MDSNGNKSTGRTLIYIFFILSVVISIATILFINISLISQGSDSQGSLFTVLLAINPPLLIILALIIFLTIKVKEVPTSRGWSIFYLIFFILTFWSVLSLVGLVGSILALNENSSLENSKVDIEPSESNLDKLNKLNKLYQSNVLSEEEFKEAKKNIIDKL